MSYTERHIVETYSVLLEGLSDFSKIGLIESLSKSLKNNKKSVDEKFYKSFGSFASQKTPEEIIYDIKKSRKFSKKDIKF